VESVREQDGKGNLALSATEQAKWMDFVEIGSSVGDVAGRVIPRRRAEVLVASGAELLGLALAASLFRILDHRTR
jgi:hypothetical protein